MNHNEWPLVFFTLLSQLGCGMLLSALIAYGTNRAGIDWSSVKPDLLLSVTIVTGIALLISFFHLAKPLHAVYALGNLGSSWLSREILTISLFFAFVAISWFSIKYLPSKTVYHQVFIIMGIISGLALMYAMIRLYMIPTVPVWNRFSTPLGFLSSCLVLGPAAFRMLLVIIQKQAYTESVSGISGVLTIIFLTGLALHMFHILYAFPGSHEISPALDQGTPALAWKISGIFLLLAGGLAWVLSLARDPVMPLQWMAVAVFILVFMAEVAGRYQFYAHYFRVGI